MRINRGPGLAESMDAAPQDRPRTARGRPQPGGPSPTTTGRGAADLLVRWMKEGGASRSRVDQMGNIFGLRAGDGSAAAGGSWASHADSVPERAAKYDGPAYGVLCAPRDPPEPERTGRRAPVIRSA